MWRRWSSCQRSGALCCGCAPTLVTLLGMIALHGFLSGLALADREM